VSVSMMLQNTELLVSTGRITVDSDAGQVSFTQVNKSDEGTYTCTAVNNAGNDSHSAQLVVRGMLTACCQYTYLSPKRGQK